MPTIQTVALPKSSAGRRAKPLDEAFVKALVNAVKKAGAGLDAKGNRPFHVCSDEYDSKGKAAAEGRRYANAVQDGTEFEKVSVRVFPNGNKFQWGIYLPLPTENAETPSEG